jgi:hypothetical protein
MIDVRVFGESARAVTTTFRNRQIQECDDGMYLLDAAFKKSDGLPLFRAMMRAEAELLLDHADVLDESAMFRTSNGRRAEALFLVITRASEAMDAAERSLAV